MWEVTVIHRINHIEHWNEDAQPFTWTATADEILAKVELIERDYRTLVSHTKDF